MSADRDLSGRRPRLALPYTVLAAPDRVRLVAGEDFRYTLSAPGVERWLPGLLAGLRGSMTVGEAVAALDAELRTQAVELLARLYGERVLVDGPAEAAHAPAARRLAAEGSGALVEELRLAPGEGAALPVLCQDRLDYAAALDFNRRRRAEGSPWLWASCGPLTRGYVGPLFLPDAGPCLGCLLGHFERLSPEPQLHRDLLEHARRGGAVKPVPFPPEGVAVLRSLVLWKASLVARGDPPPALFRLHVLELETMEVSAHRVFIDPECAECGRAG
jgi:bacteriocin biosynthesis cyclodehydratase domain-containing protein